MCLHDKLGIWYKSFHLTLFLLPVICCIPVDLVCAFKVNFAKSPCTLYVAYLPCFLQYRIPSPQTHPLFCSVDNKCTLGWQYIWEIEFPPDSFGMTDRERKRHPRSCPIKIRSADLFRRLRVKVAGTICLDQSALRDSARSQTSVLC